MRMKYTVMRPAGNMFDENDEKERSHGEERQTIIEQLHIMFSV